MEEAVNAEDIGGDYEGETGDNDRCSCWSSPLLRELSEMKHMESKISFGYESRKRLEGKLNLVSRFSASIKQFGVCSYVNFIASTVNANEYLVDPGSQDRANAGSDDGDPPIIVFNSRRRRVWAQKTSTSYVNRLHPYPTHKRNNLGLRSLKF